MPRPGEEFKCVFRTRTVAVKCPKDAGPGDIFIVKMITRNGATKARKRGVQASSSSSSSSSSPAAAAGRVLLACALLEAVGSVTFQVITQYFTPFNNTVSTFMTKKSCLWVFRFLSLR